ncbi:hypothetical protein [Enterococcus italicus]|uniref:hypothetical protein n=1 Tax=Enterococcus italicus TaxID=246144 RepID=UPI00207309D0|nr:hypothetical protein [Enterococcus italicus]
MTLKDYIGERAEQAVRIVIAYSLMLDNEGKENLASAIRSEAIDSTSVIVSDLLNKIAVVIETGSTEE